MSKFVKDLVSKEISKRVDGVQDALLVNVIGSLAVGQHPLKLIQVYLTFPLGEKALSSAAVPLLPRRRRDDDRRRGG